MDDSHAGGSRDWERGDRPRGNAVVVQRLRPRALSTASATTEAAENYYRQHPLLGEAVLLTSERLVEIAPIIRHHHEWWNGNGYPDGLKREAIPIEARIIAIADVYQALTSSRSYRPAYAKKKAINIIKKNSGIQFDPKIVDAFLKILKK